MFVEQTRREGRFTDNQETIETLRAAIARLRAGVPGRARRA